MKDDLVSVIITTFCGSKVIERAILSVINQTYSNIEIIVVDDNGYGTKEQIGTQDILNKFKKVVYIVHRTNINGAAARNTGIRSSNGKYICFLDDDDQYTIDRVESQKRILCNTKADVGVSYCSFIEKTYKGKQKVVHATKCKDIQKSLLLQKVRIGSSTIMLKKRIFDVVDGFDESFNRHQDWEFLLRVFDHYKAINMKQVGLVKYIMNRNSPKDSLNFEKYRIQYLTKYENLINKKGKNKIMNFQYCEIAQAHYLSKEYNKAKLYFKKCKNPFVKNRYIVKAFVKKCLGFIYEK